MITGEKITYVILQERPEVVDGQAVTRPLIYDSYSGGFNGTSTIEAATHFDVETEAVELATLQNNISLLLGQSFNYMVVKNVITRTSVPLTPAP